MEKGRVQLDEAGSIAETLRTTLVGNEEESRRKEGVIEELKEELRSKDLAIKQREKELDVQRIDMVSLLESKRELEVCVMCMFHFTYPSYPSQLRSLPLLSFSIEVSLFDGRCRG